MDNVYFFSFTSFTYKIWLNDKRFFVKLNFEAKHVYSILFNDDGQFYSR